MPELGIVTTTLRRGRGELPQMPLVNMFSERAITEPRQFSLISFPGLAEEGTELGSGPVTGLYQADGVLSGVVVAISGAGLYAGAVERGAVTGIVTPSIAGNEIGTVATAGDDAVFWDGTDFSVIAFPDGARVRKVFEEGGRFLFLRDGTHRFYWTDVLADALDGGGEIVIDGFDYASAESEPDALRDAVVFGGKIALGGSRTIELWSKTGDNVLPYAPIEGLVYAKGVRATGCMTLFDNTFAWVSPDHIVYRAGNVPERISDAGHEELIAASATCRIDAYFFEGHEFLKVRLDTLTIEFDAQTQQWHERKTGVDPFIGGPVIQGPVFGGMADGKLYGHADYADLGSYHERSFCAWRPMDGGTVVIDNVRLRTNPGQTDYLTGNYTNPVVELFQSYDGGLTFDAPLPEFLGAQGHYRREVEWRALGLADPPGFFAKFRVTDPVSFRASGALVNEAHGGRSR